MVVEAIDFAGIGTHGFKQSGTMEKTSVENADGGLSGRNETVVEKDFFISGHCFAHKR